MEAYSRILRLVEGDKALARNANKHFTQRDKEIAKDVKIFRNVVVDVENQIIQDLKNTSQSEWKVTRLTTILSQINSRIDTIAPLGLDVLSAEQMDIVERANDAVTQNMEIIKADPAYFTPKITNELLTALQTMSTVPISGFEKELQVETANIIRTSILRGESVSSAIDRLLERFEHGEKIGYYRAEAIARTEMLRAHSMAQYERGKQIEEANPDMLKRWVHSDKPDGRKGHIEAERKYKKNPIKVRENFRVRPYGRSPKKSQRRYNAYEECKYPRDPSLSAANVVNCACGMLYLTKKMLEQS